MKSPIKTLVRRAELAYEGVDTESLESKLRFAAETFAPKTYDPKFGLSLDQYSRLSVRNAFLHECEKMKSDSMKIAMTKYFDAPISDDERHVFADVYTTRRANADGIITAIDTAAALDRFSGLGWAVLVCMVAGFSANEIARKLGIAKTSFHRKFGPIREEFRRYLEMEVENV